MQIQTLVILLLMTFPGVLCDCYSDCEGTEITADYDDCITGCDNKWIIAVTIASALLFLFLICVIKRLKDKKWCQTYYYLKKLKQKYEGQENIDNGEVTVQRFEQFKQLFERTLHKTDSMNNFYFQREVTHVKMKLLENDIKITKISDFCYRIYIQGEDQYQKFRFQGGLICKDGKPFLWMLKIYEHQDMLIAKGYRKYLIYEGQESDCMFFGKWFSEGQQLQPSYYGKWYLISRVKNETNNALESVNSQNYVY